MLKKIGDYKSLSEVPLTHPKVKCRCLDPRIYCGDACGNMGCLAIHHKIGSCKLMEDKTNYAGNNNDIGGM